MNAESVKIEWDENGCYMVIDIDPLSVADPSGPWTLKQIILRVQDPEALYDAVKAGVLPWLMERDEARRTRPVSMRTFSAPDAEPYDLSDPKHPEFHSVHADLWDSREGK